MFCQLHYAVRIFNQMEILCCVFFFAASNGQKYKFGCLHVNLIHLDFTKPFMVETRTFGPSDLCATCTELFTGLRNVSARPLHGDIEALHAHAHWRETSTTCRDQQHRRGTHKYSFFLHTQLTLYWLKGIEPKHYTFTKHYINELRVAPLLEPGTTE